MIRSTPPIRNALRFETYDMLEAAVRNTTARCVGDHRANEIGLVSLLVGPSFDFNCRTVRGAEVGLDS